ncbi:pteridine reductase [Denitratisoma oestradiolicum]|uniref:Pteridine reductase n=1 Tax=Denitratisoma oestradiolicum TaxID=311182 RepID=A0A6S6XY64_9PROT|nr:pteridine reductase [Denitratisoma oestradiolicum]TWO80757.1 pteridine reductase [Denitratisoma oestradiolicum]CAB1370934.1 Pteridine reductase [Denitratisoma oestradiolicum]
MNPLPESTPVVLVTGAARRVGAAISRELHGTGARLVLHYRRSADEALALAGELNQLRPNSACTVQADLCDVPALERVVAETVARYGRLDGLVNNASSFFPTPMGSIDQENWHELMGSNLQGPLFLAQAAAPHLRATGGAIVNITDIHAERPLKGYPLYSASKAGLLGLTRALAIELAPRVRVNAVAPGAIAWPESGDDFPPEEREAIIAHTLLQRIGSPADIARTVRFLLFDAPYITGQVINVDGGRTAQL